MCVCVYECACVCAGAHLLVCMHLHVLFLRCHPPLFETGSLSGLELANYHKLAGH